MPRRRTEQQLFDELLDRYGREVADAFLHAFDDIRGGVDLQAVIAAVEAGSIDQAIEAMHLDAAAFSRLQDAIQSAYGAGGQAATGFMPKVQGVVIRFNVRNRAAERWLRDHSAGLVTRVLADQRVSIREALVTGMGNGENPTTTALDIVGRVNRATGKREGGIIGLTSQQAGFVANARQELKAGDAEGLRNYLTRARRDKRFDRTINKALKDGTPVPADVARKAVRAYENRLLKLRGDVVGLTETFNAIAASKHEAYRQAIENGAFAASAVTKRWRHFANENPRRQHIAMSGKVVSFDQPFILPDGTRMRFPHDPEAPIEHTAGCHCQADYRVDFLAGVK